MDLLMIKRILIYGFPLFLLLIEALFRAALKLDTNAFMGPTIAAVGVDFLLPLIVPKPRQYPFSKNIKKEIAKHKIVIIPSAEQRLIGFIWIFIFILTCSWVYSLFISSTQPSLLWLGFPAYLVLGFANYFVGVLFSEMKEVI
jgi:hypothetical protein